MKIKFTFVLLLVLFIIGGGAFAQVQINTAPVSYQPATLAQGGAPGTYTIDITNNNAAALSGAKLSVTLPSGMEYLTGTITGATPDNVSNLQTPVFALGNIPSGNTLTLTFSARINCGFVSANISYNVLSSGNTSLVTGTSPVAASTPAPAYVFSGVPAPQALSTPLSTNAIRTIKFKNSGNVSVSTVYFDTNVVTAAQYPYYKLLSSNFGTITPITNGYRITLTGAALQSAITTTSGTANATFDKDEEITLVLTEQMTSCALGSSIQLTMKAGSGDSKNSFCFFDSSTASITTPVGNPSISLTRIVGTSTWPTFCTNGTASYTIKNEGSGSKESALFNIKLPWSNYRTSAAGFGALPADGLTLKKVTIGGVDVTSQVLVLNGSPTLISGVSQNIPIVDLSRLTTAIAGVSLVDLNGDGHFDDLMPGQSFRVDFQYGWDTSKFQSCMLQSSPSLNDGNGYFTLGTSYTNQCGSVVSKFDYTYSAGVPGLTATVPGFEVGIQTRNTAYATIDKALFALGDKGTISVQVIASLSAAFYATPITKVFTVTLPDGLDYDASVTMKYNSSLTISPTYINYNTGTKVLTVTLNSALIGNGILGNDLLSIPVIATSTTAVNKTVVFKETYSQNSCPGIARDFGCSSTVLNYGFVGNCGTINTTNFQATRTSFGFIPDVSGTNKYYRPTGFVTENTPGINLQGAVSRDKIRFNLDGDVNSNNYSQLWARVSYSSLPVNLATVSVPTISNFDPVSATASEVIGTINVKKGIDGSVLTTNITVGDVAFTYDSPSQKQWIQVNVGAKIGAGLAINYTPIQGDQITVNWQVRVATDNVPALYSAITDLKGELYTKDAGGVELGCEPLPALLYLMRLYRATSNYYGTINIAGNQGFTAMAGIVNGTYNSNAGNDKFPNETRMYFNIRNAVITVPGIWKLNTGNNPYYNGNAAIGNQALDPSLFTVSYSGSNTVITFTNEAFGSDGLLSPTSNLLANDYTGANGYQRILVPLLPVCVPTGNIVVTATSTSDDFTGTQDLTAVVQNNSYTGNASGVNYVSYKANAIATLQNVDGIGSTVKWQTRVSNTTDTAAFLPSGASTTLPNNWMSFVSANNNITVTQVEQIDASNNVIATYPVVSYGAGKYWVKLGNIVTINTYNVVANYSACTNDKLQFTYGFGATGYPMDPDVGYGAELGNCTASQTSFDLNLLPKDIGITMAVSSPQNPIQFCTNPISGSEHMIDYSMEVTNTGTGNAENLILEATFPANYVARAGTSKIIYDGATRTIGDPVYNSAKGVWQWYISADANGIPFLPPSSSGNNVMTVSYQGETTCGFVSGSSVSYNMNATSGCGQLTQVAASGGGMDLSVVPPALNSYVLTHSVVDLKNDGSGAVYSIEIKNQGSNPISTNENIYITVPSSIDYVAGSVERIIGAANITEPTGNAVVGKTRIITFPLPTGASGNTLVQNETASFNIKFKIVDPAALSCGPIANAIKLESIYSVPDVTCGATQCPVIFVTGNNTSNATITKTALSIVPGASTAKFVSTVNNDVVVKYTIANTGTIASYAPIVVDFFNDINKDGLYTTGEPILYTQTINNGDATIAAGDVSPEQTTAVFTMPESGICNVTAAIRLVNNNQVCADSATLIPINFEAAQTAFTVCGKTNVTLGNLSNGATVSWSPATYLSATDISNPVFNYTGTPVTAPTNFVYTATVVHPGGCDNTYTTTVTVNPDPIITITNPAPVCAGTTVDLSAPAITAGSEADLTYSYFADADATVALVNYTAIAASGTYYIKGTNANGCYSVAPVAVTVNPLPTASIGATGPVCKGDATAPVVSFTGSNGTPPYTFTYNIGGGSNLTVSTVGTSNIVNVPVLTAAAGNFVYNLVSVQDSSSSACTQNQTGTATVTINPLPTATISGTAQVCHNGTAPQITFTGSGGTAPYTFIYKINGGDDHAVTTSGSNTATVSAPTDVTGDFVYTLVSVKDDSATECTQAQTGTATITVKALPTAVISGTATVCKNGTSPLVTFTGDNGTAPYTFKYTVNGGAEQSITTISGSSVTVAAPTNAAGDLVYELVSVRENSSCEELQTGSATITVSELPTATISSTAADACQNEPSPEITFRASGGSAPYTFKYKINGGADQTVSTSGGSTATVSVPTGTAGTFVYSLVSVTEGSTNACEQLQTGFATVTVNPTPTVAITNPAAVCSGTSVDLTAPAVTAGSTANLTYAYFTDALGTAVLANPSAVTEDGTYYIQGTTASGCKSAIEPVTVTVNLTPTVVVTNPAAVCSGTSVDLTAAAVTAGSVGVASYAYFTDAAGTSVLANPNAVTAGGTYYIQGTSAEGCKSAIQSVAVTVNPTPTVAITNPAAVCSGASVDLTAVAVTAGSTGVSSYAYYADLAGTSVLADPTAVTASGTYYIQGTSSAGCKSTIEPVIVTIDSTPALVITNPGAVCLGTAVDLTAPAVTAGSATGLTYAYYTDAAGTTDLANPNAVTASGTYYIQGTASGGCKTAIEPVIVTINPTPTVITANPAPVCSGTAVDLTAAAVTAGSTGVSTYAYYTDLAGTSVLADPAAVTAGGTYYIQGTSAAGCKSAIQPVTVTINPIPTVAITNPAAICSGTSVDLTAATVTAGSTAGLTYTYFTDEAGTAALVTPSAVTADGTYYIQGTTGEGCKSAIQPVTVTVNLTPAVAITNPAAVCSGTSVDLTAPAVTAGSVGVASYTYFTDAAGTSVLANPNAVTADGTYYIQGTSSEGCKSAIQSVTVTVNPTPTVAITNPAAVCSGTSVDLTAAAVTAGSVGVASYAYFTDAAGTSVLANPNAVTAGGTYYIQGTSAEGCKSAIQSVTVTVNALLALNGTESTACAADGTGYVLSFSVTGQAPYTVTGTGAPGTWNGNDWTSDKILAGTDYNVSVQDAYACNTVTVAGTAPICCVYEVTAPTFPVTTVACYSEIPTASSLTEAEYEALGNGDGKIGDIPCGVIEITASNGPEPSCNGDVARTYTVTEYADPNNNKVRDAGEDTVLNTTSVTQTFTLERADFAMPPNAGTTVNCSSDIVAPAVPQVIDNCGNVLTPSAPLISSVPSCNGTETYTYTFTDCAGHAHDWVYTYTINNTVAPTGTAPSNVTVQCIADIPVADINAVTNLNGNCGNAVTVTVADTNNGGSGCSSSPYIVTRTYTLTDCGGLKTELVQTLTAIDTTAPVFAGTLPADSTVECSAAIPAAATLTATDNCSAASVSYSEVKVNGSCSGNYQLIRTWTASDACGNQASYTQTIRVADTTAPVFVEALPVKEVYANCDTIPNAVTLTATDNCSNATVSYNEVKVEGDCTGRYSLIRTWIAEDECGNQNIFTQTVYVSCLEVFNAMSPNGDGINDTFKIGGIDCFPNNTVTIYNRYGVKVYEKKGYDNVTNPFEGFSDGRATVIRGDKLPTGTYFYTLEYEDNGKMVQKSAYLYINNQ